MKWPFKDMQVGEVQIIWDINPARSQVMAHNYASTKGWRFKTARIQEPDGRVGLAVKRLKNKEGYVDELKPTHRPNYHEFSYEKLAVGESCVYADDAYYIARALSGIQYRERKTGKKWRRQAIVDPVTKQYKILTITRIK